MAKERGAKTIPELDEALDFENIVVDDGTPIGKRMTKASLKALLTIEVTEMEPLVGGTTSGTALVVPNGPAGEQRTAEVSSGKWYDFGSGPVEASADRRWKSYWNGTSWVLKDMGELPVNPVNGTVAKDNPDAVPGGEVFDKTLTKSVFLFEERESPNLFDKSKVQLKKYIDAVNGSIKTATGDANEVSDWIFLRGGVTYVTSGWYGSPANRNYSLFANYGDTNSITGTRLNSPDGLITPENDCYGVFVTRNATSDVKNTLQLEEGTVATDYQPYSDVVKQKMRPEYIPSVADIEESNSSRVNIFDLTRLRKGILATDGTFTENNNGDLTTELLPIPEVTFLYIGGLGNSSADRVYKLYDADRNLVTYTYNRFKGNRYRIALDSRAKYISAYLKAADETIDLSNVYISPYKEFVKTADNIIDIRSNLKYNLLPYTNKSAVKNTTLNVSFTIASTKAIKNALVPVFLHKGTRPSGSSILERHVYLGDNVQNDFSDLGIIKDGKLMNIKVHAGNYSLTPQNSLKLRMFQDKTDGYILGSDFYEGVFKSVDDGRTWTLLKGDGAKLIFMSANGDIFYQIGQTLRRATKASNFTVENTFYTSPYTTMVMGSSNICQNTNGDIYFGTYQSEFLVQVYRSTDGGATFTRVFNNIRKQHVHKIWCHNGTVFLDVDGATLHNPNDEIPDNSSMACYQSKDNGATWEMIKFDWSTDYGVNQFMDGYYYGAAEANIKYSPSIFRSRDLKNWETIFALPFNSQSMRVFNGHLVSNSVAYWSFNRSKTLISPDGVNFLPIFDTKQLDSVNMDTALRMGIQEVPENYFTESGGEKWLPMCSGSEFLNHHKLKIGGNNYQALVYIQCDLQVGDNVFTAINTDFRNDIVKNRSFSPLYSVKFRDKMLSASNQQNVVYPVGTVLSDGRFDGYNYPYSLKDESSVNLPTAVKLSANISGVKSLRFGYKSYKWNGTSEVNILTIGTNKIIRQGTNIVLRTATNDYTLANCLRVYYDNSCLDVLLTLTGSKLSVFLNGFPATNVDCNLASLSGDSMILQDSAAMDFISDIELFDYVATGDIAKEMFEGFNIY